jgi:hypothetical protein
MTQQATILVAGPTGAGKTTWISEHLKSLPQVPAIYLNLGAGSCPIDATLLMQLHPHLQVYAEADLAAFLTAAQNQPAYLEIGFHLDLAQLVLPPAVAPCRRVAIVPADAPTSEWHVWGDEVLTGANANTSFEPAMVPMQMWRSELTGQVLDPGSLDTVWFELTHAAYGTVARAKAIFSLVDGRTFHFGFSHGDDDHSTYAELNVPGCLSGRPSHFSGIEVVGIGLNQEAMAQTLRDCCLDDQSLGFYQHQIRQSLEQSLEKESSAV